MDNNSLNPSQQPSQLSQGSPHFSKTFIMFMILLLVVIVGVGGYMLGANQNQIAQTQPVTQIPQPSPTPTIDPTIRWEIYKSPNGYSIRYPSGTELNMNVSNDAVEFELKQNNISVTFWPLDFTNNSKTIDQYLGQINDGLGPKVVSKKVEGYNVDGVAIYRREDLLENKPSIRVVIPFKNKKHLEVRGVYIDTTIDETALKTYFDQILSTFRFSN